MKTQNKQTGKRGEDLAAAHLSTKGYDILERNFSNKFGEIDIIAQDGATIVFTEVKTKVGTDFGLPEEMVGSGKLQRIRHMATLYLNGIETRCRIDVVAIVLDRDGQPIRLTHYENVT